MASDSNNRDVLRRSLHRLCEALDSIDMADHSKANKAPCHARVMGHTDICGIEQGFYRKDSIAKIRAA